MPGNPPKTGEALCNICTIYNVLSPHLPGGSQERKLKTSFRNHVTQAVHHNWCFNLFCGLTFKYIQNHCFVHIQMARKITHVLFKLMLPLQLSDVNNGSTNRTNMTYARQKIIGITYVLSVVLTVNMAFISVLQRSQ